MRSLGLFANIFGLGTAIFGLCINDADITQYGLIINLSGVVGVLTSDIKQLKQQQTIKNKNKIGFNQE